MISFFITTASDARKEKGKNIVAFIKTNTVELFLGAIFLTGMLGGSFFVQDNEFLTHGNFQLLATTAYMLFLPVLIKSISGLKNKSIAITSWIIFSLHLTGGFRQFYLILLGVLE